MLRMCALTVFGETDSCPAISGRDKLVGRYRSTRSSPGLSSPAGGDQDCCRAAGMRQDHPGRSAGDLLEPPSQACLDIYP